MIGEGLRKSFEELGPAFIKVGQIMSTRPDILPPDILDELTKLQDSVQEFPFSEVEALIKKEFNDTLENIFIEFDKKPLAAASISQVHRARLKSGEPVVVKVQRPGIENLILHDLSILKDLAGFIANHTKYGRMYDFNGMVQEMGATIINELDFTKEGQNAERFKRNFKKDSGISIPEIKWEYTTKRILTMEEIIGIRINDVDNLDKAGINRRKLAIRLTSSILNQVLRDGFFHADPHPGNIIVKNDGTIVFIDLGMVGILSEARKRNIINLFMGIASKNSRMILKSIIDMDTMSHRIGLKRFEREIDRLVDKYLSIPLNEIKIGELLSNLFKLAFSYKVKIPGEFTLISKALITLQGLIEELDDTLNVLEIASPISKKLLLNGYYLKGIGKDIKRSTFDYKDLIEEAPSFILNMFRKMEDDDFTFQLEVKDMDRYLRKVERVINRISLTVIMLAVSIIIAV